MATDPSKVIFSAGRQTGKSIRISEEMDKFIKLISGDPTYKLLKDSTHQERSYSQGGYSNTCGHCGRTFDGPKRTPQCKVCSPFELVKLIEEHGKE